MNDYGKQLLLVEDDYDIRRLLGDLFTHEGYHVYEACDGSEALVEMGKRRFDAVLSDYHMPRMDGLAFLDVSTHLWPGTPVILASCDPDLTESPGSSMFSRAFACLGKPFDLNQLLDTVHRATHERHLQRTA